MTRRLTPLLALCALLLFATPALAGNWAVVTVEDLPDGIEAGALTTITFSVRRHGSELLGGLKPTVSALHPDSGRKVSMPATALEREGFYEAAFTLDTEGVWEWQINAFNDDHPMPPLTVGPAQAAPVLTPSQMPAYLGVAAISVALVALLLWAMQRRPLRLAVALLLAIVGVSLLFYQSRSASEAAALSEVAATISTGERLFVAKGCVTCHQHTGLTQRLPSYDVDAPELTQTSRSPEWLAAWIADPADESARNSLVMPDLDLSSDEIDELVAFLTR